MFRSSFLAICLFLCFQSLAQTSGSATEAKNFGLSIVRSYFDNNCSHVFDQLSSRITSIEGGQQIQITEEQRNEFCAQSPLRNDVSVSYQEYLENYAVAVLDLKQFNAKYPEWSNNLSMKAGDYFFDGSRPIAAGAKRLFRASDMSRFLLRKMNGTWKIIAL